ncbi:VCBS repeat-containing protein [Algoriphagus namhaensis]
MNPLKEKEVYICALPFFIGTMKVKITSIFMFLGLLGACNSPEQKDAALWQLLPASETGIDFRNDLTYTEQVNPYTFRNFYNGAGVALGDINQDGLIDIFFTGNQHSNRLYLNQGNLKFKDITDAAGLASEGIWSTGVSMADINQDGLLDIYVCKSGPPGGKKRKNELFINQGNLKFTEEAEQYGLAEEGLSQHAVFFDYDKDGDLDMYLLSNSGRSVGIYDLREGQRDIRDPEGGNKLFRNEGSKFIDISEEAGIYGSSIGYGLGVTVADLNQDSWPDLYVSNDFFERDYLYLNQQNGTFKEMLPSLLPEISMGSMGADIADLNNDGWPEIFVTEMLPNEWERIKTKTPFEDWDKFQASKKSGYHHQFTRNTLQQHLGLNPQNGQPVFSEISRFTGMDATDWSWGALIFDADNDGLQDVFVANGIVKDLTDFDYVDFYTDRSADISGLKRDSVLLTRMIDEFPSTPLQNYWFKNLGDWDFQNLAAENGLDQLTFSTGSAYGDLDNDGDLDLVVNNQNEQAFIYKNQTRELDLGNYLQINLENAFGAQVTVFVGDKTLYQEYQPVKGYLSSVAPILHFGLGKSVQVDSLAILWPNGSTSEIKNIPANQRISPDPTEAFFEEKSAKNISPLFRSLPGTSPLYHTENSYVDFDQDRLRFWMISNEGPKVDAADVNGDGLDDLALPGAKGFRTTLWLQTESGEFAPSQLDLFKADSLAEDVVTHFFDANGDGHPDLLVGSGGIEFGTFNPVYQDRLYLNDGSGTFRKAPTRFKPSPTSSILDVDIDLDGDQDLIIAERIIPFQYGLPASLQVWINDGSGNFTDESARYLSQLNPIGMITNAALADLDLDGQEELILAGEWMAIRVFKLQKERIEEISAQLGLHQTEGLWQTLEVEDLNGDGFPDILAGNWGLNSRIRHTEDAPLQMMINDFDRNGALDPILVQKIQGRSIPYVLKNSLLKQLPSLRKQLLTYDDYKDKSVEELFGADLLSNSLTLSVETLETTLWLNQGDGSFKKSELPLAPQLAPVFDFEVIEHPDYDFPIILYGGNQFRVKPELGSQMGSYGGVMVTEDGKKWQTLSLEQSGFYIPGEIRSIKKLKSKSHQMVLVVRNNDEVLEFEITN